MDNHEAAPLTLTPCWWWWRSCPCFGDGDQKHKKKGHIISHIMNCMWC